MKNLLVSPSPHIHGNYSTSRLMLDVIIALSPTLLVSVLFFGFSALKLMVVSVISCVLIEFLIQKYMMKVKPSINDYSAVLTGLLLAINLPPAAPWWIAVIGSVVAIGIAKMTFGGLGQNVFNPALVGRVFLLVSFPVIMTSYSVLPEPILSFTPDAVTGATPLSLVKEGLANGQTVQQIFEANGFSDWEMLYLRLGGSTGEISALALLLGFVYLLVRKVIRPHIPLSIILTVFVFSGILWLVNPEQFVDPLFSIMTGGLLLGSIFMATDYVTSPMNPKAMVIYGVGIGVITVLIRNFGAYPEGISFAILIMNSVVPLLNKYIKPKRFGGR